MSIEAATSRWPAEPRTTGYWAMVALAAIIIAFGLLLTAGGVWLITLGGSWFYAGSGASLVVTGMLLLSGSMAGVWICAASYAAWVAWAVRRPVPDSWDNLSHLVTPTAILVLVLFCIPVLRRLNGDARPRGD